ncbi:putative mediator of RNA polymerase II transcription subunit 26 isoform X2 [Ooceraea biroi]|uniref:Uncharacterized protein n=2 Tax=Ooceraea biroi TaxID=2015173 RepID=A0A026W4Q0_OOCBI|nr:putative mediator of RNA polymerase II transcription subunit 26 isoform X2 [Ooceraea biroi]EZA51003.1 hypothetical protein X777_10530 [Ooceraea biroi]
MMLKKSRPVSHRISMGNTVHIDSNNQLHQRIPYKYFNQRIRRPTMYNVLSINWKNQIPLRASSLNKHVILPQRVPAKEFKSVHQIPEYRPEYKPEHRSELVVLPHIHQATIDDDKGPIHTIPAPNLSPADKFYNSATNAEAIANHRSHSSDPNHRTAMQNPMLLGLELAAINNDLSRRIATSLASPQHQYEVTESNNDTALKERQPVQSAGLLQSQQGLDITGLSSTLINPHQQFNGLFANHLVNSNPGIAEPSVEFIQSSIPMQTNLHSALYAGAPSAVTQIPYMEQQIPDLYVNHPTPAESPLSAAQFYKLLNNFPPQFAEQYMSDQQQILQQQLGQSYQPHAITSQSQVHSFNEKVNKLQQQQQQQQQEQQQQQKTLFDQDYVSGDITETYNLEFPERRIQSLVNIPETALQDNSMHANKEFTYSIDGIEKSENNIEYENINYQKNPVTYFDRMTDGNVSPTKFYTILPNRETAEKLAALAAAGNVNSRLMGQLQRQQHKNTQKDLMPLNHKNVDDDTNKQQVDVDRQQYSQHEPHHKNQQQYLKQNYNVKDDEKLPLQITVLDDYIASDNDQQDAREDDMDMEYGYEIEDDEIQDP